MNKIKRNDIDKIVESLNNDRIVVLETDTVFGVMARASEENKKKINRLKERDENKYVGIIFPDKETLYKDMYDISYYKKEYMDERLPGKYTFIVKLKNHYGDEERQEFGVRVTGNEYLQNIIKKTGPLLASSPNISGDKPGKNIKEIEEIFKDKDIDIVESDLTLDKASTIIRLIDDIEIIRD